MNTLTALQPLLEKIKSRPNCLKVLPEKGQKVKCLRTGEIGYAVYATGSFCGVRMSYNPIINLSLKGFFNNYKTIYNDK